MASALFMRTSGNMLAHDAVEVPFPSQFLFTFYNLPELNKELNIFLILNQVPMRSRESSMINLHPGLNNVKDHFIYIKELEFNQFFEKFFKYFMALYIIMFFNSFFAVVIFSMSFFILIIFQDHQFLLTFFYIS